MNGKRRVLVIMFVFSILIHLLFAAAWSTHLLYTVQNMIDPARRIFTVVKLPELQRADQPASMREARMTKPITAHQLTQDNTPSELAHEIIPSSAPNTAPSLPEPIKQAEIITATADMPMGPFQSKIDPKKAWINVAESVNYSLLRGISMDVSNGEYRLPDELDVRVRAKGDLTIEYPLIAAATGKEAVIYVLLLIDEQGQKVRVQIVRGDPDFDNAVLQSLEKVEFRPATLKREPVRSLLLLEFEFRRNPPEIGSF
jgi:TonB family protein